MQTWLVTQLVGVGRAFLNDTRCEGGSAFIAAVSLAVTRQLEVRKAFLINMRCESGSALIATGSLEITRWAGEAFLNNARCEGGSALIAAVSLAVISSSNGLVLRGECIAARYLEQLYSLVEIIPRNGFDVFFKHLRF